MLKKLYFLFCLFSVNYFAQTSEITFEHLGPNEGLSSAQVNCILQDKEGFLWICTYDGLNRYDGYNIVVYYHNPLDKNSISSNDINYIIEDKKGKLWIATEKDGVDIFDKSTGVFSHLINESNYPAYEGSYNVETLFEDSKGNIWIGTSGGGLIKYEVDQNKFRRYIHDASEPNSISSNTVYTIVEDINGRLWIGTRDGLNIFDYKNDMFLNFNSPGGKYLNLSENYISKLYADNRGSLWVAANHFLYTFDYVKKVFTEIKISITEKELLGYRIWALFKDEEESLWIGTTRGLFKLSKNGSDVLVYRNNPAELNSISDNYIWTIIQDFSGNVWLGTDVGINKFNLYSKKFLHIGGKKNGTSLDRIDYVWSILQDSKNNIWIGTEDGLYCWDKKINKYIEFKHDPRNKNSLCNNSVYSIKEDIQKDIWISTPNGLDRFSYKTGSFYHCKDDIGWEKNIDNNVIYKLFIAQDGIIWLAVDKIGLVKYDPNTKNYFPMKDTLSGDVNSVIKTARKFLEDKSKNIWIGSDEGLLKYNPHENSYRVYRYNSLDPTSISGNSIMSLFEDRQGNLWVGTDGKGLNFFDVKRQSFKSYFTKDGLPSNTIYGILEDDSGKLWLSSNNGLSLFNPTDGKIKKFVVSDGLQNKEFNSGAYFISKQGEMFFGGINGLNVFHPDSIRYNEYIPNVVINEIKVLNKKIPEAPVLSSGVLSLSSSQNFISFGFASLDFTSPGQNQYKYKMEGFDKNWIDAGTRRFADYTNLDPGDYTFRVIGSNNDDVWNLKGTSISVIINPPYWNTWWFRFLLFAFLLSIITYAYKRKIKSLKHETELQQKFSKQLIDSQENERRRMASELHDGIGQNLLIVINMAKMLLKKNKAAELKDELDSISETAVESINDIRRIVYDLHPYHLAQIGLTNTIRSIINTSFKGTDFKVTPIVDDISNIFIPETETHLFRIIQEAINNIIKHSKANNVWVTVQKEERELKIIIADDGVGIKKGNLDAESAGPSGFGLKGMNERVKIINGSLQINSSENGTTLLIIIPIVQKHEK